MYGNVIHKMLGNYNIRYTGLDISPKAIDHARFINPKSFNFIKGDIYNVNFQERFDCILLMYDFYNFFSPSQIIMVLKKLWSSLKEKGRIIMEVKIKEPINKYSVEYSFKNSGLFLDTPYIEVCEEGWVNNFAAGHRHLVVDLGSQKYREFRNFLRILNHKEFSEDIGRIGLSSFESYDLLPDKNRSLFILRKR